MPIISFLSSFLCYEFVCLACLYVDFETVKFAQNRAASLLFNTLLQPSLQKFSCTSLCICLINCCSLAKILHISFLSTKCYAAAVSVYFT